MKKVIAVKDYVLDKLFKLAAYLAPKALRAEWDKRISREANQVNYQLLDMQGFVRCAVCPERFGNGMRRIDVKYGDKMKKLYFCGVHHRAYLDERLPLAELVA